MQRARTRGFSLQDESRRINGLEAVYVGRPGIYGNPFVIGASGPFGRCAADALGAVGFFEDMLSDVEMISACNYPTDFSPLKGKNLACWCPIDAPCHADVLLKIANEGG
jgi:hypothetical protein